MKKLKILILCGLVAAGLLAVTNFALADGEWTSISGTSNVYNTNLGKVGIGTTNPLYLLNIMNTDTGLRGFSNDQISNDPIAPLFTLRKARGTTSSPLAIQSGDSLGNFSYMGHDGTNWSYGIRLRAFAAENWSPSTYGSFLAFDTVSNGTTSMVERMRIASNGNVGIGTANPQSTLAVNGTITTKKIKVTETGWSDFVFDNGYKLPTLAAVESHIKQYKHLPGIPSAQEIQKKGLDVSDVLAKQMQKIEELTLYMIEMKKENQAMQKENQGLKNRLNALENQVTRN